MSRPESPLVNVWPPLPPDAWLWPPAERRPFPLDHDGARLFAFGRQALWHGVAALGLAPGDEVLVPSYSHGSEVEALARAGLELQFYRCDERLEPSEDDLDQRVGARTRALLLIHYNGFPQDAARWRSWCDERGLALVEDAAQSWLAERDGVPVGSLGDLAFFCLYKSYGLPEGALSVSKSAAPPLKEDPGWGLAAVARRHALWLAHRSPAFAAAALRAKAERRYRPERDFALREIDSLPWSTTERLLDRLIAQDAAAARRANYRTLLAELGELVPAPFDRLPAGASPFFFPVRAERKDALLAALEKRGVKALDVWWEPHYAARRSQGSDVARRRATTVGLPVHQELRIADLDRIVDTACPRRRSRPELRARAVEDLRSLSAEWAELAGRAGNLFATPEWVSTWWDHYGEGRRPLVSAYRDARGNLVAILPLYRASSRSPHVLRFMGHGAGDRLGPICAPEDVERVGRAVARSLRDDHPRWDLLLAEQLPADQRWAAILGGARLRFEASPTVRVRWGSFDEFLAACSRNFREQVRRRERKLDREHGLAYRLSETEAELDADLSVLFELHSARWDGGSDAFDARRRAFHRDFAARAMEHGWLRLWTMDLAGRPAAAWYGFRYAGAEWYYQAGRDPAFEDGGAGFVLLSHTLRAAIDDGVDEYKLLRGGEAYKNRFANADDGLETFVAWRGALGAAAATGAVGGAALPRGVRQRLRRLADRGA